MAKLQKKKVAADKAKRKSDVSSGGASEINGVENEKKNTASAQSLPKASYKNVKNMTAQTVAEGDLNIVQKSIQFLREVQAELRKVTWPNRKQTAGSTAVVIVMVFIVAAFLGLVDVTLSKLVQVVLA